MDIWSERWQPAFSRALQGVWDEIGREVAADVNLKDEEIQRLERRAARLDGLEEENRALRTELSEIRAKQASQSNHVSGPTLDSQHTSKELPDNAAKVVSGHPQVYQHSSDQLFPTGPLATSDHAGAAADNMGQQDDNFSRLMQKYRNVKAEKDKVAAAARRWKESQENWEKYAITLEAKIQKLQTRLEAASRKSDRASSNGLPSSLAARETPNSEIRGEQDVCQRPPRPSPAMSFASKADSVVSFASDAVAIDLGAPASANFESVCLVDQARQVGHTNSEGSAPRIPLDRESTAGDTSDGDQASNMLPTLRKGQASAVGVIIKHEPSSDEPVIVSAKSLRRRPNVGYKGKVTREAKIEHSSDPVYEDMRTSFHPQESYDLDNPQEEASTPRKRPRSSRSMGSDSGATTARQPRHADHLGKKPSSGLLGTAQRPELRPRRLFQQPIATNESPRNNGIEPFADESPSMPLPKKLSEPSKRVNKRKRRASELATGVEELAEDGAIFDCHPRTAHTEDSNNSLHSEGGKLKSLLDPASHHNPESPGKQLGALQPIDNNQQIIRISRGADQSTGGRASRIVNDKPASITPDHRIASKGSNASSSSRSYRVQDTFRSNTTNPKTPASAQLRNRPLDELALSDFRLNPKYSHGYKGAYSEVVRGKSERADLNGCTDAECCGKYFRPYAEAHLIAGGPSILERHDEITMMEDFLGDEAYLLAKMERPERERVWIEAKMRQLAKEAGRHRQRFTRRPSPVGFWNMDFPSTQEIQRNKEETDKVEMRMVEERRREALRKDGKWYFRDE